MHSADARTHARTHAHRQAGTHQVVKGDRVDGAEVVEAVLEGGVVPVPGHDVEGRGGEARLEELARELVGLWSWWLGGKDGWLEVLLGNLFLRCKCR